jgi:hypothetical protein
MHASTSRCPQPCAGAARGPAHLLADAAYGVQRRGAHVRQQLAVLAGEVREGAQRRAARQHQRVVPRLGELVHHDSNLCERDLAELRSSSLGSRID